MYYFLSTAATFNIFGSVNIVLQLNTVLLLSLISLAWLKTTFHIALFICCNGCLGFNALVTIIHCSALYFRVLVIFKPLIQGQETFFLSIIYFFNTCKYLLAIKSSLKPTFILISYQLHTCT